MEPRLYTRFLRQRWHKKSKPAQPTQKVKKVKPNPIQSNTMVNPTHVMSVSGTSPLLSSCNPSICVPFKTGYTYLGKHCKLTIWDNIWRSSLQLQLILVQHREPQKTLPVAKLMGPRMYDYTAESHQGGTGPRMGVAGEIRLSWTPASTRDPTFA